MPNTYNDEPQNNEQFFKGLLSAPGLRIGAFTVRLFCLTFLLLFPAFASAELNKADRDLLASLCPGVLHDPRGAEFVRVRIPTSIDADFDDAVRFGWLVRGRGYQMDRVYFADGTYTNVWDRRLVKQLDLVGRVKQFLNARQPPDTLAGEWLAQQANALFGLFQKDERHFYKPNYAETYLPLAAWLHRLGHDAEAAQMLSIARALLDDPVAELKSSLADWCLKNAIQAFIRVNDDQAWQATEVYLERHLNLKHLGSAFAIQNLRAELERRQKNGHWNRTRPSSLPKDYAMWPLAKKTAYLIESLEDMAPKRASWDCSFYLGLEEHTHTQALYELGEATVPALLDVVEKDERLTRYPKDVFPGPRRTYEFQSVADVAETLLAAIWRTSELPPLPADAPAAAKPRAAQMRHYWKTYGHLPLEERMMAVLANSTCGVSARRQAAQVLSCWKSGYQQGLGYAIITHPTKAGEGHPLVAKFKKPTIAEAILQTLDDDLAQLDLVSSPTSAVERYMNFLVQLGDTRAAAALNQRAGDATERRIRIRYAVAAAALGKADAWKHVCRELAEGTLFTADERKNDARGRFHTLIQSELNDLLSVLHQLPSAEGEQALVALYGPKHPDAERVVGCLLLEVFLRNGESSLWFQHPHSMHVLRRLLADEKPTGNTLFFKDDEIIYQRPTGRDGYPISPALTDPKHRRAEGEERFCDAAAMQMTNYLRGTPEYHTLLKEPDTALKQLKAFFDQHQDHIRPLTDDEQVLLGFRRPQYIPHPKPLGRPATKADVAAGTALFELNGRGKVAPIPQASWVVLKSDKGERPDWGLIVQAETDADGKAVYGVVFRHRLQRVNADEIARYSEAKAPRE